MIKPLGNNTFQQLLLFTGLFAGVLMLLPTTAEGALLEMPVTSITASTSPDVVYITHSQELLQDAYDTYGGVTYTNRIQPTTTYGDTQCYPAGGGASGSRPTDTYTSNVTISESFVDSTPTYADCSGSGWYYHTAYNTLEGTSTNSYYVKFYYNATYGSINYSASSTDDVCEGLNCTYIDHVLPSFDDWESSNPVNYYANYYVNSNDVTNSDNLKVILTVQTIEEEAPLLTSSTNNTYTYSIIYTDVEHQISDNMNINVPTTTVLMYWNLIEEFTESPKWYEFWKDSYSYHTVLATDFSQFCFSPSSSDCMTEAELQTKIAEINEANVQASIKANEECNGVTDIKAECLESRMNTVTDTVLHAPPLGYVTRIHEIFSATTSSSTDYDLELNFPTTSPMHGTNLTLDIDDNVSSTIAYLNTQIDGDGTGAYDNFMIIWNLVWYTLLAFWILKQVLGTFDFNFSAGNYQKSGSVRGVARTGTNQMKRNQFKSYD